MTHGVERYRFCLGVAAILLFPAHPQPAAAAHMNKTIYVRYTPNGSAFDYVLKDTVVHLRQISSNHAYVCIVSPPTASGPTHRHLWVPRTSIDPRPAVDSLPTDGPCETRSGKTRVLFSYYHLTAFHQPALLIGPSRGAPPALAAVSKGCNAPVGPATLDNFVGIASTENSRDRRPVYNSAERHYYYWVTRGCHLGKVGWIRDDSIDFSHPVRLGEFGVPALCKRTCGVVCKNSKRSIVRFDVNTCKCTSTGNRTPLCRLFGISYCRTRGGLFDWGLGSLTAADQSGAVRGPLNKPPCNGRCCRGNGSANNALTDAIDEDDEVCGEPFDEDDEVGCQSELVCDPDESEGICGDGSVDGCEQCDGNSCSDGAPCRDDCTCASHFAYITNFYSDNVSVIDTSTNTVTATVGVGSGPQGVAVNPSGTRAYVVNRDSDNVSVIDTSTNTPTATVGVGSLPQSAAVSPSGTRVYVANAYGHSVTVIDTSTNSVTATVPIGSDPFGVAVNPSGTRVYVTSFYGDSVSVIDTSTNTVTATVAGAWNLPGGVAVNRSGTRVYVANWSSGDVAVIDTSTNTVTATVGVGSYPYSLAVNPSGTRVYVANFHSDNVSVIDTSTNTVTANVGVGSLPFGVAVNSSGTRVYVANWNSDNVSVIDTSTNTVTATVGVGSHPAAFGQFLGP